MAPTDTIVAPSTPQGESALAVIRVSGPLASPLAQALHVRGAPEPRRVWHGDYRDRDGALVDDVVACFFRAPHSYTGEDTLEITAHGNPWIVARIVEDCQRRGCRLSAPGEYTRRAFLNGRLDLTAAEAVMDVIRARGDRALEAAQRQLRGALGRRVQGLVDRLLQACAGIEAHIDFPEDDLPAEDRAVHRAAIAGVLHEARRLRETHRHGEILRGGARVVLLGEPNAGKSSLLNRLAGYDRAIVSEEPGTTRDFLEEPILVGPYWIRVVDTAGLREGAAGVERAGVERSLERAEVADVFLLVRDRTLPHPALPASVLSRVNKTNTLVVLNKSDLGGPVSAVPAPLADCGRVDVSALTGEGVDSLRRALVEVLDGLSQASGADDEGVAVNARHAAALEEVEAALERALALLDGGAALEFVGSDLRSAVDALGEVVGRVDHEQVLDRVFATFCIGK